MFIATCAAAHEFWIGPREARLSPGETLVADLLQGQHFKGNALRFNPAKFERFGVVGPDGETAVTSRLGDAPALSQPLDAPGLHVVVYAGRPERTTYFALADFQAAAAYEGLGDVAARHRARNLPLEAFSEGYTRYSKALVRVGEGPMPADRTLGLPIELVFEDAPHAAPTPASARVRALLFGRPMANAQVRVFSRSREADPGAPADETVLRTDARGRAAVPLAPGRAYLLSSVHLREPSAALARSRDVVWETLWAASTFDTAD